jgi:uncharacterized protein (UPF0548 family)
VNAVRRPDRAAIDAHLEEQGKLPLSYDSVGATRDGPERLPTAVSERFSVDHSRECLGAGAETFERARRALERWAMFDVGWAELCWPQAPIEPGTAVGVLARVGGIWVLSACRIVYLLDDAASDVRVRRFGFGYGTLPDHGVRGEERFSVEWRRDDDSVWYDLHAISEPANVATRLGRRSLRALQARFATDSRQAMRRATGGG